MSRAEAFLLTVAFAVFTLAYGALPWLAGGLYLDTHEGDSYHLIDILTRMERGDVPHIDFVTPLGALSFWPVQWIMAWGQSAGAALILAQLSVALCLLPAVAYAAVTRLTRGVAIYFGLTTLGVILALSYGTPSSGVGISMHYNRWAWAFAFVMLLLAFLPARGRTRAGIDGVLIGLLAAALLLTKITYFVALVPAAGLALWQLHGAKGTLYALAAGVLVALTVTFAHGLGFWFAYLHDLRLVSSTDIRPFVGMSFDQILADPTHLGATLAGIAAALVLRRSAPKLTGYAVLLLIPGFLYVTYQNFGNDPHWLVFLPVLLLGSWPRLDGEMFGADIRRVATVTAISAIAVFFPSFSNLALSPVSHLSFDKSEFFPILPEAAGHQDVFIRRDRAYMPTAQVFRDQEPGPFEAYAAKVDRAPLPEFQGVTFPSCEWMAGSRALFETLGADLVEAGLPDGSRLLTADLMAAYWFFAPVLPPANSAPWYYGRLSGLEHTDFVMVPKCAFSMRARNIALDEMAAAETSFTLVRDNELLALFSVNRDQLSASE